MRSRRWPAFVLSASMMALTPSAASADTLTLGFLSFDVLIPGDDTSPGLNAFTIGNFTGDPATGGFALDPDFPVFTALTFLDSSLTIDLDGSSQLIDLGDVGPGFFSDLGGVLLFPDTALISSAVFSATLDTTGLLLFDGRTLAADSTVLTLTLLSSLGSGLTPGVDFGVLTVEATEAPVPVPEPGTLVLLASGLAGAGARGIRRRRRPLARGDPGP